MRISTLNLFLSLFSLGLNVLEGFLRPLIEKGLRSVILFGVPMKCQKVSFRIRKREKEEQVNLIFLYLPIFARTPEARRQMMPQAPRFQPSSY
jgi:hypothetical protein